MIRFPRLSIRSLLLLIAYLAISLAMLRASSDLALRLLTTGLMASILVTTLAALVDSGPHRARAAGFALFATIYWLTSILPGLEPIGNRLPHAWVVEVGLPLIRPDLPFTLDDILLQRNPRGFRTFPVIETLIALSAFTAGVCGWLVGGHLGRTQGEPARETSS